MLFYQFIYLGQIPDISFMKFGIHLIIEMKKFGISLPISGQEELVINGKFFP